MLSSGSITGINALEKSLPFKTHPKRTSWLVLDLITPKATELNIPESQSGSWTENRTPLPASHFKYFKTVVPHLLLAFDMYYKEKKQLTWYFGHCSFGSENEEDELIELSKEEELSPPGFSWQHFPKTLT